jgi:hypothetical protein
VSDVDQFLLERTLRLAYATVPSVELYIAFVAWSVHYGEPIPSPKWLGRRLRERGFTPVRTNAERRWRGLRLLRHVTPSRPPDGDGHLSLSAQHAASTSAARAREGGRS